MVDGFWIHNPSNQKIICSYFHLSSLYWTLPLCGSENERLRANVPGVGPVNPRCDIPRAVSETGGDRETGQPRPRSFLARPPCRQRLLLQPYNPAVCGVVLSGLWPGCVTSHDVCVCGGGAGGQLSRGVTRCTARSINSGEQSGACASRRVLRATAVRSYRGVRAQ